MQEESAGGIVFKKEAVIPAKAGIRGNGSRVEPGMTILVSQHSGHHGWIFPKGHIGDKIANETKEEAALREVKEETGVAGKIIQPLPPITYWYVFGKEKHHKIVWYFLMEYVSGDIQDHDFEMEKVEWLPMDQVEKRLTYPGDKKVWREAKEILMNDY